MVDIVFGFEDVEVFDDPKCAFKGELLLFLAKKHGLKYFVETGTYAGEMLKYVLDRYDWEMTYSIELGESLFNRAVELFSNRPDWNKVALIKGNSGDILRYIEMPSPALFWLDAHYCGGDTAQGEKITPIYEELNIVLNDIPHVIVVDDLDNFPKWGVYGRELEGFIRSKKDVDIHVVDTMLIIEPRTNAETRE